MEHVLCAIVSSDRARREEVLGGVHNFGDALKRCQSEDEKRAFRELCNAFALFSRKGFDQRIDSVPDVGAVVRLLKRAGRELPSDLVGKRLGTGTPNAPRNEPKPPPRKPHELRYIVRKPEFSWNGLARRILADALKNPPQMMIVGEFHDRLRVAGNRAIGLGELVFRQLQAEKRIGLKATEPVDIVALRGFITERERDERPILRRLNEFRVQL